MASDGSLSVALDTALTEELRSEDRAREVASRIQRARRDLGLEVTDRIRLRYHSDFIAGEVLAVAVLSGPMQGGMRFKVGDSALCTWREPLLLCERHAPPPDYLNRRSER